MNTLSAISSPSIGDYPKRGKKKIERTLLQRNHLNRDELIERSREEGSLYTEPVEPPVQIGDPEKFGGHPEFNDVAGTYQPGQPFVCELPDCILMGKRVVGLSPEGKVILESVSPNYGRFRYRRKFLLDNYYKRFLFRLATPVSLPCKRYEHSHVFPLVSIHWSGYYNWILEYLPKLRMLRTYEQETGKEPIILLQKDAPRYMAESIELAGYSPERYTEWKPGEVKVDNLVISRHNVRRYSGGFDYNPSPKDCKWLRETLVNNISTDNGNEYSKRVYISRQEVTERGRKVVNHDELMQELEERGFVSYVLEKMSFEQQVGLLSNADYIVGPHGAGLVNMVFAEDAHVLEIFNTEFLKTPYYLLSQVLNHEYDHVVGQTHDDDIIVDVEEIISIIDSTV